MDIHFFSKIDGWLDGQEKIEGWLDGYKNQSDGWMDWKKIEG